MAHNKRLNKRQTAIAELVKTQTIEDQSSLINLLETTYGIQTNQAAISRDLRKLGISKRLRGTTMAYDLPTVNVVAEIMQFAVKAVVHNENMIVIKTVPGTAAAVADFIDANDSLEVLGTISGENTIFATPRSIASIEETYKRVCEYLKTKD